MVQQSIESKSDESNEEYCPVAALIESILSSSITSQSERRGRLMALEQAKGLLALTLTEVNRLIVVEKRDLLSTSISSTGAVVCLQVEDIQLVEPRGRFKLTLTTEGLVIESKSDAISMSWSQVSVVALVPASTSAKKEGEGLLAIKLKSGVSNGKKDLFGLVFNLSKSPNALIRSAEGVEGTQMEVVSGAVGRLWGHKIVQPDNSLFISSRNQCFLRCYKGTQEGTLYPLRNGILFLKPMVFIPSEEIASITAGRGGSAVTRYVDILVSTVDDKGNHEFSNIEREELLGLQTYVHMYLEMRRRAEVKAAAAMGLVKQERGEEVDGGGGHEEGEEDDDDESDYDYEDDNGDSSSSAYSSDDDEQGEGQGGGQGEGQSEMHECGMGAKNKRCLGAEPIKSAKRVKV